LKHDNPPHPYAGRPSANRDNPVMRRGRNYAAAKLARWQGGAVLALTVMVLVVVAIAAASASGVPTVDPVKSVQVDIIGDSLSTGFKTPGDTWPTQAQALVTSMGLKANITNASENGAGYVQPGDGADVYLDLVNRIVNSQSQVVMLFGSDNDTGASGVDGAMQQTLARVKVLAPDAKVIVVGPTSESNDTAGQLTVIRQSLAKQAAAIGARFIDPVSLGWFQGEGAKNLANDLEHPNSAGEKFLAQAMTAILAPDIKSAMRQDQLKKAISGKVLLGTLKKG
jgi:acyl-CoA thioesterase-1